MHGFFHWPLQLLLNKPPDSLLHLVFIQGTLFAWCDFTAQFILIYRCWIVWGRNIRVAIIPSTLAFAFLVSWLAGVYSTIIISGQLQNPPWAQFVPIASLTMSLTVNALVTGLIVFKILKVSRQVKAGGASDGSKLRRTIFILIESGMALFSVQFIRLVVTIVWTDAAIKAISIIIPIHQMLNGITPTIILVRISKGLYFYNEKPKEEVVIGSFHFASNHPNSVPDTESIGVVTIVGQDSRNDDDTIGIISDNEIEVVARV